MTDDIEDLAVEQQHIADCAGMIDYEHFKAYKKNSAKGLMLLGNNWESALGLALLESCDKDAVKIIRTWSSLTSQFEMLYKMNAAREKATS